LTSALVDLALLMVTFLLAVSGFVLANAIVPFLGSVGWWVFTRQRLLGLIWTDNKPKAISLALGSLALIAVVHGVMFAAGAAIYLGVTE
jgi:hypothetical protein